MNKSPIYVILGGLGGLLVIGFIIWFFIAIFEFPIEEGTAVKKYHDPAHLTYKLVEDAIYTTSYYNISGKMQSQRTFSHYEYAIFEYYDGEDFIVVLNKPSEKHEGEVLERFVYVKDYRYEMIEEGSYVVIDEHEYGDSTYDNNNVRTRKTRWTRSRPSLLEFKHLEY